MIHFSHIDFWALVVITMYVSSILQYTIKSEETKVKVNFKFKKGVEIAIKSKETSS